MTSSHDWDSGSLGEPAPGQHSAGTDPFDSPGSSTSSDAGAKERAQQAADTAKQEGAHVAETAKDEAQQVIGEAKDKAANLLDDARAQLGEQSRSQLQALASRLEELSGEVDSMVEGSDVQGTVTDLARQLSSKTRALSQQLADREPGDLLDDVRSFARQRPGTFLAGALAAGIVAGRLTRGAKKAHDAPSPTSGSTGAASGASGSPAGSRVSAATGTTPPPTAGDLTNDSAVGGLGGSIQDVPEGQNTGGRL